GECVRLLGVDGVAAGSDADAAGRKLRRAAARAAPADQRRDRRAMAPLVRQRGLLVDLGAHAVFEIEGVAEGRKARVAGLLLTPREVAAHAALRCEAGDPVSDAQQQRIRALAEAGDE